jgi:hypothetical protein
MIVPYEMKAKKLFRNFAFSKFRKHISIGSRPKYSVNVLPNI